MNNRGETLVESLAALVIIMLIFMMLPASLTIAAKANHDTEQVVTECPVSRDSSKKINNAKIKLSYGDKSVEAEVDAYCEEGFYYYDVKEN